MTNLPPPSPDNSVANSQSPSAPNGKADDDGQRDRNSSEVKNSPRNSPVRGAGTAETRHVDRTDELIQAFQDEADARGRWSFETVWRLEQATIRARRARVTAPSPLDQGESEQASSATAKASDSSSPSAKAVTETNTNTDANSNVGEDPTANAIDEALDATTGLALSGGGIRSASFNLGVLQAFAQQRMIGSLDYLSTVSGGGYIGSWLTCWICRDGDVRNVEKLLVPDRSTNAEAYRQFVLTDRLAVNEFVTPRVNTQVIVEKEPEPIVHLRANSNYLALRPGIFTPDSWALIAIYLRNILLNSLVVIPTLLAVILFTMWLTSWYQQYAEHHTPRAFLAGIVLIGFAVQGVFKSLDGVRDSVAGEDAKAKEVEYWDMYFGWLVIATVAAAYSISLDLVSPHSWFLWFFGGGEGEILFTTMFACLFGLLLGGIHMFLNLAAIVELIRGSKKEKLILWPISGFASGFVMGVLVYAVACFLQTFPFVDIAQPSYLARAGAKEFALSRNEYQALLAVPMLLTSFFIAEVVQVGILGRQELPEVREKWSAFQARCFMGGLIWFALVLHVFFIANFTAIFEHVTGGAVVPTTIAGLTWLASALGSLSLAQGSSSPGQKAGSNSRKWRDVAIMAGPPIFLSGLLAGTAALLLRFVREDSLHLATNLAIPTWLAGASMLLIAFIMGRFVDINIFSLQELYAARLIRCFLGASRRDNRPPRGAPFRTYATLRRPDPITSMAPQDDLTLASLRTALDSSVNTYNGPLHLINTAVNLTRDIDLQRQERKADSFVFSPIACGNPQLKFRPTASIGNDPGYAGGVNLGTAVALSGAAVSPNMGYYSSPAVTALLTVFNVRLGAWMSNPLSTEWKQPGPRMGWLHLIKEMMGLTDASSDYVYISDGGHFDNLGVYELLRRRVTYIFSSDAGADPKGHCNELGMIIRKAYVDFGIEIDINISDLQIDPDSLASKANFAIGTIRYPALTLPSGQVLPQKVGTLIYIKMTRTGHEPTDIETYHGAHPDFPQQSTIHQFYSESQFESYRHLGYHIGSALLKNKEGTLLTKR